MDTHELAWAAGFFDGEGCFSRNRNTPKAEIKQRHREVLERFAQAVGTGYIYEGRLLGKPIYSYRETGFERTIQVAKLLWPWLGSVKKQQFEIVMKSVGKPRMGYPPRSRSREEFV